MLSLERCLLFYFKMILKPLFQLSNYFLKRIVITIHISEDRLARGSSFEFFILTRLCTFYERLET